MRMRAIAVLSSRSGRRGSRSTISSRGTASRRLWLDAAGDRGRGDGPWPPGRTVPGGRDPTARRPGRGHPAARLRGGQPGVRTVVVVDPGLSTTGALDFTQPGMLDADPHYVADSLGDLHQLPGLSGVSVVFQGLGETTGPQPALDPSHRAHLTAI